MKTYIGKFVVTKTDTRYRAYPKYQYMIRAANNTTFGYDYMSMHNLDDWCRQMWGFPYWLAGGDRNSEWNRHGDWAQEFNYRLKEKRVYLRSEDELLQFTLRWSGE